MPARALWNPPIPAKRSTNRKRMSLKIVPQADIQRLSEARGEHGAFRRLANHGKVVTFRRHPFGWCSWESGFAAVEFSFRPRRSTKIPALSRFERLRIHLPRGGSADTRAQPDAVSKVRHPRTRRAQRTDDFVGQIRPAGDQSAFGAAPTRTPNYDRYAATIRGLTQSSARTTPP
jgi:hypothetical protein